MMEKKYRNKSIAIAVISVLLISAAIYIAYYYLNSTTHVYGGTFIRIDSLQYYAATKSLTESGEFIRGYLC